MPPARVGTVPLDGASTQIGTTCVEARIELGGSDSIDGGQEKRGAVGRGVKKPTAPRGPRLPDQDRGASLERRPKRTIPVGAPSFLRAWLLAGLTKKFQFLPIVHPNPRPSLAAPPVARVVSRCAEESVDVAVPM